MSEEEAYRYVLKTLQTERIVPYLPEELEIVRSSEACINCGTCVNHCPVVAAVGVSRFSGPRSIAIELSRSPPEFWSTADMVYLCTGCGTCREVCPKKVNIPEIVNLVRSRIFESRPELVPRELHEVNKIVSKYSLSFEPWEDPDEKIESRLARLDRLGLPNIPDRRVKGATVLFYPGCQAEERSQEVRESAKLILDHFDVDYTMLDEMSCCGLPSRLVGDEKTSRVLFDTLMKRIQSTGAKIVVTTCAGCTGNLIEMSRRTGSTVPVLHMLEFLIEHIGKERLSRELASVRTPAEPIIVGLHHPCHLIRHTSRRLADYALEILGMIPGIDLRTTGVSDWCCGGGGMVGYHSRDVSDSVTTINVKGIVRSGVQRVLAPCPLCTAQIDSSLYRSGAKAEAEDLTVFVAQHLPLRRRTD